MLNLHKLQGEFLGYLQGKPSGVINEIQPCDTVPRHTRLNIYATGYRLRLKEAMTTDFSRLALYLGDDLFDQLIDAYIQRYPSTFTNLRYYSQYMLAFIAAQAPFNAVPELQEITGIEQAFTHAFDAEDRAPLSIQHLVDVPADAWPTMCFSCHPSVRVLSHHYNSFPIWQALAQQQIPPELATDPAQWLVWRRDLISEYRCLPEAEAMVLHLALAGENFATLCESLLAFYTEAEVPSQAVTWIQQWINDQIVTELVI